MQSPRDDAETNEQGMWTFSILLDSANFPALAGLLGAGTIRGPRLYSIGLGASYT